MQICRIWVTAVWDKHPALGEAVAAGQRVAASRGAARVALGRRLEGPCPTLIPPQWKSHPTLSQLNPHPSTLPTSFAISVVLWCFFLVLAHLPCPQVWLGCLNVEGTGMAICILFTKQLIKYFL